MTIKTEEKLKAIDLRKQGLSFNVIAETLKVSKGNLSRWLKGIPQPHEFTSEGKAEKRKERLDKLDKEIEIRKKNRKNYKKVSGPAPYEDYWVYGPILHKKDGRYYAHLRHKQLRKSRTTQYSRYLVEISLGQRLSKDVEVDHIDCNKTNDILENLQIIDKKSHRLKTTLEYKKGVIPPHFNTSPQVGEDKSGAILFNKQVEEIRSLFETKNYRIPELAIKFGISKKQAYAVITGRVYKHLKIFRTSTKGFSYRFKGSSRNTSRKPRTLEKTPEILKLRSQGLSYEKISVLVHISPSTVKNIIKENNLLGSSLIGKRSASGADPAGSNPAFPTTL